MIAITMLVVILMVVTVATQQTSFVVNVGAMLTIPHMFQVKITGHVFFSNGTC